MPPLERIATRRTHRLRMRDGVRLAVDVWLPRDARAPLPAVVLTTRYMRAVRWSAVARAAGLDALLDIHGTTRRRMLEAGYAWVDVDARGSGASEGARPCPWHREEVRDGAEVVDWIVAQPWSSGRVGATGVSYAGTAAEMLLVNRHPAVRAIAPRFSLYDVYPDVAFPGGIHLAWFTKEWAAFNRLLDQNRYPSAVGSMVRVNMKALAEYLRDRELARAGALVAAAEGPRTARVIEAIMGVLSRGVRPPDEDEASALAAVIECHAQNADVHEASRRIVHRDDAGLSPDEPDAGIDSFSPHAYAADIAQSGAAVLSVSGWLDGAYQHAAIKRHRALPPDRTWLQIGPWDHGGRQNVSPFDPRGRTDYDHDGELVRFFDAHLKDGPAWDAPRVRYFTLGEERWKSADRWPPPGATTRTLYLDRDRRLSHEAPPLGGSETHELDHDVGTGARSRWRSLLGLAAPVGYGDRRSLGSRLLCFDGPPLDAPLEITGHPVVRLFVAADAPDATLFAYLEEVALDGRVTYVTEGQLRALHRRFREPPRPGLPPERTFARADAATMRPDEPVELAFDLLPISYRVPARHRIRLSIAGADADHFARIPDAPSAITVLHGGAHASRIDLPIVDRR